MVKDKALKEITDGMGRTLAAIVQDVLDGKESPLEAVTMIHRLQGFLELCLCEVDPVARDYMEKNHPGKVHVDGHLLEMKEGPHGLPVIDVTPIETHETTKN